jgi:hypothetical protein
VSTPAGNRAFKVGDRVRCRFLGPGVVVGTVTALLPAQLGRVLRVKVRIDSGAHTGEWEPAESDLRPISVVEEVALLEGK